MAEILGKRLLGGVEVAKVGEILKALRLQDASTSPTPAFGFRPLDRLIQAATEGQHDAAKTSPVVELVSLHPGGGATHLLYHLTALAVLPREYGGRQTCAVIFDTDGHFDVNELATELRLFTNTQNMGNGADVWDDTIINALRHIHIFRPQSLTSLTTTLDALPFYLLDQQRHFSFDRSVGFIAIDSASAFYWQDRAETEDAAFYAKTSGDPGPAPPSGYVAFTAALKKACGTLHCPAVFTSWHLGPTPSAAPHPTRSFRPSLPHLLATLPTLRLACQRIPVKKFPPLISVEGARREAGDRLAAVEEGKFECFVDEWGVDERTLKRVTEMNGGGGGGFECKITHDGMVLKE